MWTVIFLLCFYIQNSKSLNEKFSLHDFNCSLSFEISTIYQSNKIQTNFPIRFRANYNLTCGHQGVTAYYKITPLAILLVGKYKHPEENIKSMIEINGTQFYFSINQSSTIRLCLVSFDDDDDDDQIDTDYRICRQIHIGINTLYEFWNLPMKIFYIILFSSTVIYYVVLFIREQWRKGWKKSNVRAPPARPLVTNEKHDTFENEKVNEERLSADEDEDE